MRPYDISRMRNDDEQCNKNESFNILSQIFFGYLEKFERDSGSRTNSIK